MENMIIPVHILTKRWIFRKITSDQALCEEIKSLDLNLSDFSSEEDEVEEFRIIDLSKKPNDVL
jgi:hypothetical protein